MVSKRVTHRRRRQRGRGTLSGYNAVHDPIHLMNHLARQSGGFMIPMGIMRRGNAVRQSGRGLGSWARTAFKRDEYGRLLKRDLRHI